VKYLDRRTSPQWANTSRAQGAGVYRLPDICDNLSLSIQKQLIGRERTMTEIMWLWLWLLIAPPIIMFLMDMFAG
jgi:hypothetical protein